MKKNKSKKQKHDREIVEIFSFSHFVCRFLKQQPIDDNQMIK